MTNPFIIRPSGVGSRMLISDVGFPVIVNQTPPPEPPPPPPPEPLYSTDFVGTNGDPWPSPWVATTSGVSIQGNRGRLAYWGTYEATCAYLDATSSFDDFRLEGSWRINSTSERYIRIIHFRSSKDFQTGTDRMTNSYNLYWDPWTGGININKDVSSSHTFLDSFEFDISANTDYRYTIICDGTSIKVKMWDESTSEPESWGVEFSDSSLSSGVIATSFVPGVGGSENIEHNFIEVWE